MEGCFFGSADYDEYYFNKVKQVKEFLENRLIPEINSLKDNEEITFETWY